HPTQRNSPRPGLPAGVDSFGSRQTWAGDLCFDSDSEPFPYGTEIEWAPVLDPGKDAEVNLTAVSGQTVYNPQPDESGYCAGASCPGQPIACGSDADCGGCGGVCDLAQGP